MEFIYVGDLVNTHGLKGEVRIISNFEHKDKIFVPNFNIYIGKLKEKLTIKTHRVHKNYDMLTLEGIDSIEDALKYKGEIVYINRNDLNIDYVEQDMIGMDVYDNKSYLGKVENLKQGIKYNFLVIKHNDKEYMIPNIHEFIQDVDIKNKVIKINNIKGLTDEN